jgi:hypothetical protein
MKIIFETLALGIIGIFAYGVGWLFKAVVLGWWL